MEIQYWKVLISSRVTIVRESMAGKGVHQPQAADRKPRVANR